MLRRAVRRAGRRRREHAARSRGRSTLGIQEALAPLGDAAVKSGTRNIGGSIATASGLVFIGATNDRRFRAFDARTGRELWTPNCPRARTRRPSPTWAATAPSTSSSPPAAGPTLAEGCRPQTRSWRSSWRLHPGVRTEEASRCSRFASHPASSDLRFAQPSCREPLEESIGPCVHGQVARGHAEGAVDLIVDMDSAGFPAAFHAANNARQPLVTLKCVEPTAMKSGARGRAP